MPLEVPSIPLKAAHRVVLLLFLVSGIGASSSIAVKGKDKPPGEPIKPIGPKKPVPDPDAPVKPLDPKNPAPAPEPDAPIKPF